jgi:predicted Zn-dependent peptidase
MPIDEYVAVLRSVTLDDVNAVLADVLAPEPTLAQVGPAGG